MKWLEKIWNEAKELPANLVLKIGEILNYLNPLNRLAGSGGEGRSAKGVAADAVARVTPGGEIALAALRAAGDELAERRRRVFGRWGE